METPYTPPNAESDDRKPNSWRKWLLWGCAGSLLLLLLLLGSCYLVIKGSMSAGENQFGPACAQYLGKLESKEFDGAYELTGKEFKQSMTKEKHKALMSGVMGHLGPVKKMDVQFVQTGIDQNGRTGTIVYKTEFQNGPGTIRFTLRKTDNKYFIIGVFFESPILTNYLNDSLSKTP